MTRTVDLNADMGEGFGVWAMGNDARLLEIVTSANLACGFHAGDPNVMAQTIRLAAKRDVGIGAHPGFADLQGFGRQRLTLPPDSVTNLIQYQLGAAQALARANRTKIRHMKLHGALANMASEDKELALTCYRAALAVAPQIVIMVLAGTAQHDAVDQLGCMTACEIFADRAYNNDATLMDRSLPGAVIHDAEFASRRMVDMIKARAIITASGKHIPIRIDTICLHGDTPEAIEIAKATRQALGVAGVLVKKFMAGNA